MIKKDYSIGYALFISCAAAMGGFLFGFDTSVINGTLDALKFRLDLSPAQLGIAASIAVLGAAVGAFSAGNLANKFGRRKIMITASILFTISSIGSGYPYLLPFLANRLEFIVWRVLGGIGIGAVSVIVPAYIAEVSPAALRGRLASMQQFAIVIGIFTALLSNYFIASLGGGGAAVMDELREIIGVTTVGPFETWQIMFWMELIPAVIYGTLVLFIPESPRYLVACKQHEKAAGVLSHILSPQAVAQKIEDIKKSLQSEIAPRITDLIEKAGGKARIVPILWVGIGLAMLQQFVGINVIFYYGNLLWEAVGFNQQDAMLTSVLSSVVNISSTIIAIALVDKVGRKPLLLIGSLGMFFTLGVNAVVFGTAGLDAHGLPILEGAAAYTAVVSANLFVVFFAFSWGPVVWILLGEMFNNRIRGAALAVCGLFHWIGNFIVSSTFPILLHSIGLCGAYGLYCAFAFASLFFVFIMVRETKGMELEDM